MSDVIELEGPFDWFHIDGRGDVVTFKNMLAETFDDLPLAYYGKLVRIEGHEYTVSAVERFAVERQMGRTIGLLLKEPRVIE